MASLDINQNCKTTDYHEKLVKNIMDLIGPTAPVAVIKFLKYLIALCFTTLLSQSAFAESYNFKFHHFLSANSFWQKQILEPWVSAVEQNSNGRVSIEIFPSMTLGGRPPELVQQARDGVVDIIWTVNGYTPGIFPRSEVFELPTVFTNDPVSVNLAINDLFETDLKADYEGLEVMFLSVHAGNAIHMRSSAVNTASDLVGKKLRTPSRTGAWSIEALGGIPVAMPVPALPQALQKGVVDGAFVPWEIIPALQLQHQTNFQIEGYNQERIGSLMFQTSMNKAKWDSLPEDIKASFEQASGPEWGAEIGLKLKRGEAEGLKIATDAGNTYVILSKAETKGLTNVLSSVVNRWIENVATKNIDGEALVSKARKAIASHLTH